MAKKKTGITGRRALCNCFAAVRDETRRDEVWLRLNKLKKDSDYANWNGSYKGELIESTSQWKRAEEEGFGWVGTTRRYVSLYIPKPDTYCVFESILVPCLLLDVRCWMQFLGCCRDKVAYGVGVELI